MPFCGKSGGQVPSQSPGVWNATAGQPESLHRYMIPTKRLPLLRELAAKRTEGEDHGAIEDTHYFLPRERDAALSHYRAAAANRCAFSPSGFCVANIHSHPRERLLW